MLGISALRVSKWAGERSRWNLYLEFHKKKKTRAESGKENLGLHCKTSSWIYAWLLSIVLEQMISGIGVWRTLWRPWEEFKGILLTTVLSVFEMLETIYHETILFRHSLKEERQMDNKDMGENVLCPWPPQKFKSELHGDKWGWLSSRKQKQSMVAKLWERNPITVWCDWNLALKL